LNKKKDKILFWMESYQIQFGIAKALIEKYDCDPYALIVCSPQQKLFFNNQKLIKFKKTWNLRDNLNLNNHKLNIEKLKFFEEKFSLSLNKIIYGDRFFYKYNFYHKFSDEEIFSLLEQELNFYDQMLDELNPDYVIIRTPEFQDIELFHEICKAKNIKVLVLSSARLGNRWIVSEKINPIVSLEHIDKDLKIKTFGELREIGKEYTKIRKRVFPLQKSEIGEKISLLFSLFSIFAKSNINNYRDFGKTPWTTVITRIKLLINSFFKLSFLNKNTITSIENIPYVYFPLHYEPERTILRSGEYYSNQLNVIKNISQSLPVNINLLVKEHPEMKSFGWRDLKFYKEILGMHNVKFIHPSVSNEKLIQNSKMICTIAGTTAIDALFYNKPSVSLTELNCSLMSCIFTTNNLDELPVLIKKCLNSKVDLIELNHYVNNLKKSTFSSDLFYLGTLAAKIFGKGGFVDNAPISERKMKEFLEEYTHEFDILALEHIKKIKSINHES
jgi:hypothetical protein